MVRIHVQFDTQFGGITDGFRVPGEMSGIGHDTQNQGLIGSMGGARTCTPTCCN